MATTVYDSGYVYLVDGRQIEIAPLKIKYLRKLMSIYDSIKDAKNDDEAISVLSECVLETMPQYLPEIKTIDQLEDSFDLPNIYLVLKHSAGISIKDEEEDERNVLDQAKSEGKSWDDLELAKLESELFLLGIWKDYDDLETSLSMPELTATLEAKRDQEYNDKKFHAAMQGVDLDKNSNKGQDEWEQMKARVFSGGKTSDPNDVTSLQGINAQRAGFGIGMGLDYVDLTKK
jgi:hypothetical protein